MRKKVAKSSARSQRSRWTDPDDAPEVTEAMLARATLYKGDKVVRRGRPPLGEQPKQPVTLRLDADVIAAYRATGSGWQSRINADLRRMQKLKKRA